MKLIVGLGNPGEKYDGTRHNIGFDALDFLLKKYEPLEKSVWDNDKKTKSEIKKLTIGKTPALLAKPQTYMNNSGLAVSLLLQYYKLKWPRIDHKYYQNRQIYKNSNGCRPPAF